MEGAFEGWEWEAEVEQAVELHGPGGDIRLVGHIDLLGHQFGRQLDRPLDRYLVREIKTTEHKPIDYLLWSLQHRVYCYIMQALHPNAAVLFDYLTLSTTGRASLSDYWVWTEAAQAETERDVYSLLQLMQADTAPRFSRGCQYCDYAPLCTERLFRPDSFMELVESFKASSPTENFTFTEGERNA